jgi:uncharacterized membrane protein YqiK
MKPEEEIISKAREIEQTIESMSINDFMEAHVSEIRNIITDLQEKFSSHDFIEKFAKKYESEYINMLVLYKNQDAFKTVHAQIARFLSLNMSILGIKKNNKDFSENVFGDRDIVQWWEK